MKRVGVSVLKILAFVLLWALLSAAVIMSAVAVAGEDFYSVRPVRIAVEIGLMAAVLIPMIALALFVDRRAPASLGFGPQRLVDLVSGTVLGALILAAPLGVLVAIGAAVYAPDWSGFTIEALALGLALCLANVVTQEALVRGYMFQELWAKYGAWIATGVTTAIFVAIHAGPILQGGTQGLIAAANILLASLLLSLAYVRTGALWLPIGIHLGWNGLQGPVLNINVTGTDLALGRWTVFEFPGDALLTGGALGVEGGLVGLIGPVIGLAIVAFAFKQQPKPDFTPARAR